MILTAQQLRPFLYGAVETEIKNGALCPYKCTAETRAKWQGLAEFLREMAEHTSGIRLDLMTYADHIAFTVAGGTFDLLIDGKLAAHKTVGQIPDIIAADLPDKGDPNPENTRDHARLCRVTLVFPNLTKGRFYSMEIPDELILRLPDYKEKFLFLGDSITQGWTGESPSKSYAWQVSRHFDADCIIHGVGGAYFHPDVFEAPENFDPDRVFVAMGTNDFDWGNTPEQARDLTAAYLDKVKAAYGEKKVYCILPIWRGDAKVKKWKDEYDRCIAYIRAEEEKRGFTIIDGQSLVPHDPQFFAPDLLHPNDAGFSLYAQNLIRAMEQ